MKRKADDDFETPVKKAKAQPDSAKSQSDSSKSSSLFVGNLSWNVDDKALFEAFESFEDLTSARVVTDKNTGRARGFGYVDFGNPDAAEKALEAMKGTMLDGRPLNVDFSAPKAPGEFKTPGDRAKKYGDVLSEESDTLFVGNIPFEVDESAISELFEDVAKVKNLRLPTDL